MSNTAFIDDWNSIIPFKIKAADLEKPTEQFLYKAVLHIFKLMHYDVSIYEHMYTEGADTSTVKREFVARINYIYQLCSDSKQTSFYYVDLVKPTAKKVIHLLKILLNYLFYINMVKETVLENANNCIENYFELNAKLNQEQAANEEKKIRACNMNRHIDDLKSKLPEMSRQIESQEQCKQNLHEKLVALKAAQQELADKIVLLKLEYVELTEQKITDEEVCALKATYEALERDIESLTESEKIMQRTNAIHVKTISEMKPCITLLEKLLQSTLDDSWKTIRSDVEQLTSLCDKAEIKFNGLLSMADTLNSNCTEIEMHLEERQQELCVRQKVLDKSKKRNDSKLNDYEKYVSNLNETNELLEQILMQQRMEVARIIDMSKESINLINKSII
ncbi:uncharacterized protein LOC131281531 [Anopheles ziemanni]|uniref:uncharacterized protein LOC131265501 n=1 Tax=Anopheles coustani TaxID=139045 RepID=UPI00265B5810|nr:uncharacterized protein LOC131265501 [Anopheles coustani]XP_058166851.1 uncharacterized protein LOC131281531 [Anopheles ziemanni]